MWEPRRLRTLWTSTACYRNTFTFTYYFLFNFLDVSVCWRRWRSRVRNGACLNILKMYLSVFPLSSCNSSRNHAGNTKNVLVATTLKFKVLQKYLHANNLERYMLILRLIRSFLCNSAKILSRGRDSVTNNYGFWSRWWDLLTPSYTISLNHNQLQRSHWSTHFTNY
jgi:hypothetical protein